ncbi:hypothetical protein AN478_12020 [Thiohalorhabdus denitrificans]|nr:hypothetical protein AN478_12020 [Thiohalorhabdus denitrificans]
MGSLTVKVVGTGVGFVTAVMLARMLGPQGYGIYAYVTSLVTLMAIPAQFGLPTLVVRETAQAQVKEQWGVMRGLWRWASLTAILFSLAVAGIGLLLAWFFFGHYSNIQLATFYGGLALIPLIALGKLRGAALRGLRYGVWGQIPERVLRPILFIAFLGGANIFLPQGALGASEAMMLNVVAVALTFLVGALLLNHNKPRELLKKPVPEYRIKGWLGAVGPFALLSGTQLIMKNTDILLIGALGTIEEVGYYRVAVQGSLLLVFALEAINMIIAPHFTHLFHRGDYQKIQQLVTWSIRASLAFAFPFLLIFAFLGREILGFVFGSPYTEAYSPLLILSFGQLINAAFGPVGSLLNMTGNEKDTAKWLGVAALLNVGLNLILIPLWGIVGAAVGTAVSFILWNVLLSRVVRERLGVKTYGVRA